MPPKISEDKTKRILQLKYDVGLTTKVIAERLGVSERSIYYICRDARRAAAARRIQAPIEAPSEPLIS